MKFYPVVIPTLNRYEHLKRCVESLSRCTYADKTELVIGLDYPLKDSHWPGYLLIKDYITTIQGFLKVTVFYRDTNWGPYKNGVDIWNYAMEKYGAVISTEDDNEFAPCFLQYMDAALEKYENDENIMSISSYLSPVFQNKIKTNTFLSYDSNAWGFGTWQRKEKQYASLPNEYYVNILHSFKLSWKVFSHYPACLGMLLSMVQKNAHYGDVKRTCYNILNNTYQLRPNHSLSRNWGFDGSGVHCNSQVTEIFSKQSIYSSSTIDINDAIPKCESSRWLMLKQSLLPNSFHQFFYLIKIMVKYLIYRIGVKKKS